jgi:hypothetical protein
VDESGVPAPESTPEELPWPEPLDELLELGPDELPELPIDVPLEPPDEPVPDELLDEPVPDELAPEEPVPAALAPDELVPDDVAPEEPPGTSADPPPDALFAPPELLPDALPVLPIAPVVSGLLEQEAQTFPIQAATKAKDTADQRLFTVRSYVSRVDFAALGERERRAKLRRADALRGQNGS